MTCPAKAYQVDVEETACVRCPAKAYQVEVEKTACEMPRKSIPSRSRENGLRDPVKAGVTGVLCTQQTQLSISSNLPAAGFPAWAGTGSGSGVAVSAHCTANSAGALSRSALCGRTWL